MVAVTGTSVTSAPTHTGAGNLNNLISGSSEAPIVNFSVGGLPNMTLPKNRGVALGGNPNYGFKLLDVVLGYLVGTANATAMTFAAYTYKVTDGAAPPAAGTAYGGTFTFNEPPVQPATVGTAALGLATSADEYLIQCVPAGANAPFFNADNTRLVFEWGWTNGVSGTLTIHSITVHGTLAWFG